MAFHISNLGAFGGGLNHDMAGFVPETNDDPWTLEYDHGGQATHDEHGELTEYGKWWEEDRWPEIVAEAVKATEKAKARINVWQDENT